MSNDSAPSPYRGGNLFLDSLTRGELDSLLAAASVEQMEIRHLLFEPEDELRYVYFPLSGVISLVTPMIEGDAVEMATVGNEGVVGLPWVREAGVHAHARGICQVRGESIRVTADKFREELAAGGRLATYSGQFDRALVALIGQNAACNGLHPIIQRCARWLLMTHERVGSDEFHLTHEFLGQMLGARRASVTEAAAHLQDLGAITYKRGTISVLNRAVLDKQACECYVAVRSIFDDLYSDPTPGS